MMRVQGIAALFCLITPALAQQQVDPKNMYERVWCVVPMVGAGTPDDPRRPAHAPLPKEISAESGIMAFTYVLSDDGNSALLELVARNKVAFQSVLSDTRPGVQVFIKGKNKREEVEAAFKLLRKDFDIRNFGVPVQ